MTNRLLIIQKNINSGKHLARHYRKTKWRVETAATIAEAKAILSKGTFDPHVIICEPEFPDRDLSDHLQDLREPTRNSEWIFIFEKNGHLDIDCIDELAYDFLQEPLEQKRLDVIVTRALRSALTRRRLHNYSNADHLRYRIDAYIGRSEPAMAVKTMLSQLIEVPLNTFIINGETGTGKGLIARIIHHCGLRHNAPLVELNCAALPKELLESELFGHEAGAFTGAKNRHRGLFEQADGGTLFLDEISEMDLELQAKLLKAIEDKTIRRLGSEREIQVDVQIAAATGADLEQATRKGIFREDLYHRLSVFHITLPPLRERKDDLVELVPHIIAEHNAKANKRIEIIPDPVWEKLLHHDWPGNVRELRNVLERCVLLSKDEILPEQWLQLRKQRIHDDIQPTINGQQISLPLDGSMALDEMDRFIIQAALEINRHNVTETARMLGTTRETLRYRIQKYNL